MSAVPNGRLGGCAAHSLQHKTRIGSVGDEGTSHVPALAQPATCPVGYLVQQALYILHAILAWPLDMQIECCAVFVSFRRWNGGGSENICTGGAWRLASLEPVTPTSRYRTRSALYTTKSAHHQAGQHLGENRVAREATARPPEVALAGPKRRHGLSAIC